MGILTKKELEDLRKWEDHCIEKYGYYLHALVNGAKDSFTGEICDDYVPGFCDIHSHGLELMRYPNIRIVCNYGLSDDNLFKTIQTLCKSILEADKERNKNFQVGTDANPLISFEKEKSEKVNLIPADQELNYVDLFDCNDIQIINPGTIEPITIGKLIKDPDENNVLRFIRIDVPSEYIQPQLQKLEMLQNSKGLLN